MRRLASLFVSVSLVCVFSDAPVRAQERGERTISLREVVDKARENPPAVLAALATLQKFTAQESVAKTAYLPRITLNAQTGLTHNSAPMVSAIPTQTGIPDYVHYRIHSNAETAQASANLDWTLFDASRGGTVKSATLQREQQRFNLGAAQRAAIQAAVDLYVRGVYAQQLISDAELSMQRRDDQLQSITALVKAGVRPAVEVERASIEAVAARHGLEIRIIESKAAMAALASAIGEDPASPVRPAPLVSDPFIAATNLNEATRLAVENRADIQALESALAARQAEHRAAIGLRIPTLGAAGIGQVSYLNVLGSGVAAEGTTYGGSGYLYMRWSILDPTVWRRAKVTNQAILEAQRNLESTILQVRAQVADAVYQAQRAKAQLDQATEILVSATTTRVAQNQRYRAGVATLLDLLDAENVEQNARLSRIQAARDYDIARADLMAICGIIDRLAPSAK